MDTSKQPPAISSVGINGFCMPQVGLGCMMYEQDSDGVYDIVKEAIDQGYRHFDNSPVYFTEPGVGRAVQEKLTSGDIKREDVFITSKLPLYAHQPEKVREAVNISLKNLRLQFIDLYLIHSPFAFLPTFEFDGPFTKHQFGEKLRNKDYELYQESDIIKVWKILEDCVDEGLIKAIGVSNFNSKQVQMILDACRIKPANIQIESHPLLTNKQLIDFCQDRGLTVTAFTPLAASIPLESDLKDMVSPLNYEEIKAIARKHSKTPAQVLLRFQIQRNVAVIPKTSKAHRLKENIHMFDFSLDEEDMRCIYNLNTNQRIYVYPWAMEHKDYPFYEKF